MLHEIWERDYDSFSLFVYSLYNPEVSMQLWSWVVFRVEHTCQLCGHFIQHRSTTCVDATNVSRKVHRLQKNTVQQTCPFLQVMSKMPCYCELMSTRIPQSVGRGMFLWDDILQYVLNWLADTRHITIFITGFPEWCC